MSKATLVVILFILISIFLYVVSPRDPLDILRHPLDYRAALINKMGLTK